MSMERSPQAPDDPGTGSHVDHERRDRRVALAIVLAIPVGLVLAYLLIVGFAILNGFRG